MNLHVHAHAHIVYKPQHFKGRLYLIVTIWNFRNEKKIDLMVTVLTMLRKAGTVKQCQHLDAKRSG